MASTCRSRARKPTNIPLIPGSSIKGVLRAMGPWPTKSIARRSVLTPTRLPRTLAACSFRTPIWCSSLSKPPWHVRVGHVALHSPAARRDGVGAGVDLGELPSDLTEALVTGEKLTASAKVVFEDLDFIARPDDTLKNLADAVAGHLFEPADCGFFTDRVCLVCDDVMALLLQTSTGITTRIKLDEGTKTVAGGQLWSEEALPVESVLAGLVVDACEAVWKGRHDAKGRGHARPREEPRVRRRCAARGQGHRGSRALPAAARPGSRVDSWQLWTKTGPSWRSNMSLS